MMNIKAHSFFPENRKTSKPLYKGKKIFTLDGFKLFREEAGDVIDWLSRKVFKVKLPENRTEGSTVGRQKAI